MKSKIILFTVTLAILTTLYIAGCTKKTENVVKIGAVFPLSGKFAPMGEPLKFATEIAINDINSKGGVNGEKIEVIFEDSKGEPKEGVTKVQKLVTVDKVPIVTSFLTGTCEAIKPVTEQNNVLFLAQTVAPRIMLNSKLTVRFHYSFTVEGKVLAQYMIDNKFKKAGFIHSNDPSTSYQVDSVISPMLKSNGIEFVNESFSVGNKEFAAIVQKMKAANCDVIYIGAYGNDFPPILNELRTQQYTYPSVSICGNIGFIELPEDTPVDLYQNVVFTTPEFMLDTNNAKLNKFREEYRKLSGKQTIGYAAYYAYDMMMILSDVINKTKNSNPVDIRKNFVGDFGGFGGPYVISPEGDVSPTVILGRFEGKRIVKYINTNVSQK